jgi:hypothetical protein
MPVDKSVDNLWITCEQLCIVYNIYIVYCLYEYLYFVVLYFVFYTVSISILSLYLFNNYRLIYDQCLKNRQWGIGVLGVLNWLTIEQLSQNDFASSRSSAKKGSSSLCLAHAYMSYPPSYPLLCRLKHLIEFFKSASQIGSHK